MKQNFLNTLGLCTRAGRCVFGEESCVDAIRGNKAQLVLLDSDTGKNTTKRIVDCCNFRQVELITFNKEELDAPKACGKSAKVIVITDKGFANNLRKYIANDSTGV